MTEQSYGADVPPEIPSEPLDLLWGAEAIGSAINATRRRAFHLLEAGELPAKKVGGRWVASRAELQRHFSGVAA